MRSLKLIVSLQRTDCAELLGGFRFLEEIEPQTAKFGRFGLVSGFQSRLNRTHCDGGEGRVNVATDGIAAMGEVIGIS